MAVRWYVAEGLAAILVGLIVVLLVCETQVLSYLLSDKLAVERALKCEIAARKLVKEIFNPRNLTGLVSRIETESGNRGYDSFRYSPSILIIDLASNKTAVLAVPCKG